MGLILNSNANMFKKIGYALSAVALVFMASASTAAAQFSTTTASDVVNDLTSDVGSVFGAVVVAIIALLAALIGLAIGKDYLINKALNARVASVEGHFRKNNPDL